MGFLLRQAQSILVSFCTYPNLRLLHIFSYKFSSAGRAPSANNLPPPPPLTGTEEMATLQVVVTGGAGQIAYSLIPLIARGVVFGPGARVHLRLLDIPPSAKALEGGGGGGKMLG